jgi:hypothetical protein
LAELDEQAMHGLMLGNDSLVLVALIDDLGQVPHHLAYIVVGDDHQLVQCREQPSVGGVFAMQSLGVKLAWEFLQLVADAVAGLLEDAAKKADVLDGEIKGYGGAAPRRVLISHEELALLVVRLPVGVSAPPGAAY